MAWPRCLHPVVCVTTVLLAVGAHARPAPPAGPVDRFLAAADSIARSGDQGALTPFVAEHPLLVGAAVAKLLDVAFASASAGDTTSEETTVELAQRIAIAHEHENHSIAPKTLVAAYRGWSPADRAAKTKAMELEKQADAARAFGANDRAVELLDQARALYTGIGDRHAVAVIDGSLGVAHWYRADMDSVGACYERALAERRGVEDRILEGKTLNGLGSVNLRTGDYDAAVEFYRKAIDLRRRTGDLAGLGTSLTYLGNCYYQMDRLVEARDYFEEALPILERVGDDSQMIQVLNGVANLYSDMNRMQAANDAYRRAIDIARTASSPADEATCRTNLATNLQNAGKYTEALSQLDAAAALLEDSPEPFRLADLYRTRASVWVNLGELDRAREDLMKLLKVSEGLSEPMYWIDAQLMTAEVYLALGAFDKAAGAAEKTIATARRHNVVRMERAGEATAARVDTRRGDYESALAHWRSAQKISEENDNEAGAFEARLGIAGVLALDGRRDEARRLYRTYIAEATDKGLLANLSVAHQGIAHTYEDENPDSASTHYDAALAAYERSLQSLGVSGAGSEFLAGDRRRVYEEVARYYAKLYREGHGESWSGRAFSTVEAAKARGLLDQLRQSSAFESTAAEESLLDSLYTLTAHKPRDRETVSALERRYETLRQARIDRSTASIDDTVRGLDDVRTALDDGTVMLSYALGDTASLLWAIDQEGSRLYTLPPRGALSERVTQLRDAIARPGGGDDVLRRCARELYTDLVAPAADRIDGAKRIVIAPDGILCELPFEVLLVRDPAVGKPWKDDAFLGRELPIVYAPSASVFVALEESAPDDDYDLDLLAVGDPAYRKGGDLARLPHTRDEVEAISADVGAGRRQVLLGADATESALREAVRTHHPRILHLAAHGLVDPNDPAASSIALTEGHNTNYDGKLHTLEIASMRIRSALVVLSACESARGRLSRSEGVVGLSRAFLASGARGVVASLWAVSDESTAALMKEMYGRMFSRHESAARALWEARVALLDSSRYSHPFHWAAFIAIGTDRSPW